MRCFFFQLGRKPTRFTPPFECAKVAKCACQANRESAPNPPTPHRLKKPECGIIEGMKTLANRDSQGGRTFGRTMGQKLTSLKGQHYDPETQKPHNYVEFKRLDGGRYWTRTSDPYRVKVVL